MHIHIHLHIHTYECMYVDVYVYISFSSSYIPYTRYILYELYAIYCALHSIIMSRVVDYILFASYISLYTSRCSLDTACEIRCTICYLLSDTYYLLKSIYNE